MHTQTASPGIFPISYAFVVQLAGDTPLVAEGLTGRVEHIASGQASRFPSIEALVAFMVARLYEVRQHAAAAEDSPDSKANHRQGEAS